jgi:hypothetical protein
MIGVALGGVVLGIVLLFIFPWVGVPIAVVAAILFMVYAVGFVRRIPHNRP